MSSWQSKKDEDPTCDDTDCTVDGRCIFTTCDNEDAICDTGSVKKEFPATIDIDSINLQNIQANVVKEMMWRLD